MYNKLKSDVFLREADVYYVGYGVSWRSVDSEIDVSIGHIVGDNSILSLDIQDVEVAQDRVIVRTPKGGKAVFQESDLI